MSITLICIAIAIFGLIIGTIIIMLKQIRAIKMYNEELNKFNELESIKGKTEFSRLSIMAYTNLRKSGYFILASCIITIIVNLFIFYQYILTAII